MAEDELTNFLRQQARSLDNLLALTPAKNMFVEDVSDQWKRKKQTPEQKQAARKAKLDPANWKSAKDVYDERAAAKKRKREHEESGQSNIEEKTSFPSKEEENEPKSVKKQKTSKEGIPGRSNDYGPRDPNSDHLDNPNLLKKSRKRANKAEKKKLKEERKAQIKAKTQAQKDSSSTQASDPVKKSKTKSHRNEKLLAISNNQNKGATQASKNHSVPKESPGTLAPETGAGLPSSADDWEEDESHNQSDASSPSAPSSPEISDIMSPPQHSTSSSVSSIPPNIFDIVEKPMKVSPSLSETSKPQQTTLATSQDAPTESERQAARDRLQKQISQMRSQRKADEKPIRSRAELLEQRRQEEQKRKAAKKEQRRKEKEEEAQRQDEEMAKRFSPGGSGSLLGSPRSPMVDYGDGGNFSFGRIAFGDGTQFDSSKLAASESKKRKGPSDPASALKAAQSKASRLSGLDEQKRQEIDEKDMWLNAKKRAHGEKIKDDTSLLRKALKRQEKQKHKSEKDWDQRVEGVRSAQEAKQKKRTENLQKRRDEKLSKKSGKKSKVKRPGFEGSFRGRTGSSKKK